MVTTPVIDVSHLGPYEDGPTTPLWWGWIGLVLIEIIVFSSFLSTYFYLKMGVPAWPPSDVGPPALFWPTLGTVILIASSICMYIGEQAIKKGNIRKLQIFQTVAIVLGVVFLSFKYIEYTTEVTYTWDSHAYGSVIWTTSMFHAAHVISVVMKAVVIAILAYRNYFNAERHLGVEVNGLYWHFVVVIWLPIYFVFYWSPRVF